MTTTRLLLAALALALFAPTAAHAATTFGTPSTIAGFGNQPALAQVSGAAVDVGGAATVAGSSDNRSGGVDRRRAVIAVGGRPAQGFGPGSGAYGVAFAADASGHSAMTWSVGSVAYLTTCQAAHCSTQRVGSSALKPESAVAVQPRSGRTIVLWRGRTRGGVNRLQWRITTNGRLGATHTLGEFGDAPQVATDALGKTVAVWLADRRRGLSGVRTAARQKGEFLKPATVTAAPAADVRVTTSDDGDTVAAWLSGAQAGNPEGASGAVQVATRSRTTGFGPPGTLGAGTTVTLAEAPDGFTVVVTEQQLPGNATVVAGSRRGPRGPFPPLTQIATTQFVSTVYPPAAAVASGGRALVSWAASGIFASVAAPGEPFGAPQHLADTQAATAQQPTGAAISPSRAAVAWAGPRGVQVAAG